MLMHTHARMHAQPVRIGDVVTLTSRVVYTGASESSSAQAPEAGPLAAVFQVGFVRMQCVMCVCMCMMVMHDSLDQATRSPDMKRGR